jgi:enoyl-CoA hydratase/carnithine racemase
MEFETAVKLSGTKDFSEGIHAFLEKRKPKWESSDFIFAIA